MNEHIRLAEPFRALFYAPFYLAELQGRFAAEGLDVVMETAGTPTLAAEAILSGRADVAWSGPMRVMQHRAADPASPLTAFCAAVMRDPFLVVGRAPRPNFTLRDLTGLRLGLVSEVPTPVWCLEAELAAAGAEPLRERGPTMAENLAALRRGDLDAAQLFEPFAALAEAEGGAVWHAQATAGPMAYSALYASSTTLRERRPAMRAMVRAVAAALRWLNAADPAEAAAALDPRFPDLPRDIRARAIARYQGLGLWADGPLLPEAAFRALGQAMLAQGALPHIPDFALCVDQAVVTEALAT
ncbi:MAG: ABC transporter substrate-binding protein [Acetobacteraceae bacterium]|nr:ABC transporter substrate-binding protein [Acetobacteraceae bacterium]